MEWWGAQRALWLLGLFKAHQWFSQHSHEHGMFEYHHCSQVKNSEGYTLESLRGLGFMSTTALYPSGWYHSNTPELALRLISGEESGCYMRAWTPAVVPCELENMHLTYSSLFFFFLFWFLFLLGSRQQKRFFWTKDKSTPMRKEFKFINRKCTMQLCFQIGRIGHEVQEDTSPRLTHRPERNKRAVKQYRIW